MDGRWRKGRTSFFQGRSWNKCLKNDVKVVFYKSVILNPDGSSLRKTSRREVIVGRSRTSPPCRCTRSLSWGVCCWMEPSAWTCRQIRWTTSAITSSRRWSTPIRWIAFLNCTNNLDAFCIIMNNRSSFHSTAMSLWGSSIVFNLQFKHHSLLVEKAVKLQNTLKPFSSISNLLANIFNIATLGASGTLGDEIKSYYLKTKG